MSEKIETDVLIVGAGPAGLAAALKLRQLDKGLSIMIIEKAKEPGAHLLSGAILDPISIKELLPNFIELGAPVESQVEQDQVYFLTDNDALPLPTPPSLDNHGCYIMSICKFTRWFSKYVESQGIDIFPGFPGESLLYDNGKVIGVKVQDMGIGRDGKQKPNFQPGPEIIAKVTILAEGTLGTLTRQLIKKFKLDDQRNPQVYATGVKEIWQTSNFAAGKVIHTLGFPLVNIFGGSFIYGMKDNFISLGLVVALDYDNPRLDIHREFQRFKTHQFIQKIINGGKMVEYGAKTIPEGGYYSVPKVSAPGALIVGDSAGLVNVLRLKGIHLAIKSGMLAAEASFDHVKNNKPLENYEKALEDSFVIKEMCKSRFFKQGFKYGSIPGMIFAGISQMTGGWAPVPRKINASYEYMDYLNKTTEITTFKFDEKLTFNKTTDVFYSGTFHDEDTPSHLKVSSTDTCLNKCTKEYGNPCQNFCPASVYEWVVDDTAPRGRLQVNFANCVHCKTCDIKDPYQNIEWVTPEGGGGPNYKNL